MNQIAYILTRVENDHNQYGEYFVAYYDHQPSAKELTPLVGEDRAAHVAKGGGRRNGEDTWYHLRKETSSNTEPHPFIPDPEPIENQDLIDFLYQVLPSDGEYETHDTETTQEQSDAFELMTEWLDQNWKNNTVASAKSSATKVGEIFAKHLDMKKITGPMTRKRFQGLIDKYTAPEPTNQFTPRLENKDLYAEIPPRGILDDELMYEGYSTEPARNVGNYAQAMRDALREWAKNTAAIHHQVPSHPKPILVLISGGEQLDHKTRQSIQDHYIILEVEAANPDEIRILLIDPANKQLLTKIYEQRTS